MALFSKTVGRFCLRGLIQQRQFVSVRQPIFSSALSSRLRIEGILTQAQKAYSVAYVSLEHELSRLEESHHTREVPPNSDWFLNRYGETHFHEHDGLNPAEWALVYVEKDEKGRTLVTYSFYAMAFGALLFGGIVIGDQLRRGENPFQFAMGLGLVSLMGAIFAIRYRRYGVLRVYSNKAQQELWERWRIDQLALPPGKRNINPPIRYYRLIHEDLLGKEHMFDYNSFQVTDAVERPRYMDRALNGNFCVEGRSWAVHLNNFEEPFDYELLDPNNYEEALQKIRKERGYNYSDRIIINKDKLPDYDQKVKNFFDEHLHTDEEIRFIVDGNGYFDVRDKSDVWIRIQVEPGDLIILPAGIYHRFTVDHKDYISVIRLFAGEPKWTPYNRPADNMKERQQYVQDIQCGS